MPGSGGSSLEEANVRTDRGKAFIEHEPKLSNSEIQRALDTDRMALSLAGKPVLHPSGVIQFLAIKIALADGTSPIVLLDRMAAAAMKTVIESADSINWDGNALVPGPTSH